MDYYWCSSTVIKTSVQYILEYVKNNDLIVYGGFAIHLFLQDRTGYGIYDPVRSVPDIDVYSSNFVEDAKKMVSYLEGVGYRDVYASRALFPFTVRLWIGGVCVCDITHLQSSTVKKVDPTRTKQGVLVCGGLYLQSELLIDLATPFVYSSVLKRRKKIKERFDTLVDASSNHHPVVVSAAPSFHQKTVACFVDSQENWCFYGMSAFAILNAMFYSDFSIDPPSDSSAVYIPEVIYHKDSRTITFKGVDQIEWLTDGVIVPYDAVTARRPSYGNAVPQEYSFPISSYAASSETTNSNTTAVTGYCYLSKQLLASRTDDGVRVVNVYTLMLYFIMKFYDTGSDIYLIWYRHCLHMARRVEETVEKTNDKELERKLVLSPLYLNLETIGSDFKNVYNLIGNAFVWPTKYTSSDSPEKTFDISKNPLFEPRR